LLLSLQTLMWVTLASVVVYLAYNTAGMYVTEELGAVTRTVRGSPVVKQHESGSKECGAHLVAGGALRGHHAHNGADMHIGKCSFRHCTRVTTRLMTQG
jgi:hypothetical protein